MGEIQVSIIIKALNEEVNIAKCIESCIKETAGYSCEIILVDSLSTDNTVEIAKQYPIRIIQFLNKEDASCGAAPQLGYQYSLGEYIYLIDGDMECIPGFIPKAMQYMDQNCGVAGVGGQLVDIQINTVADRRRASYYSGIKIDKEVNRLISTRCY
jgi:glycosyltransferase involved in cell wall biosynthesis